MRVSVTVSMPLSLIAELNGACATSGQSRSQFVVDAITRLIINNQVINNQVCSSLTPKSTEKIREEKIRDPDLTPARSKADANYAADFLEFWKIYPKQTGKGAAWASWQKAEPDLGAVKTALAWQMASKDWTKDNGSYVPMPATYLNQRRWEDEPKKAADFWANSMYPELGK